VEHFFLQPRLANLDDILLANLPLQFYIDKEVTVDNVTAALKRLPANKALGLGSLPSVLFKGYRNTLA